MAGRPYSSPFGRNGLVAGSGISRGKDIVKGASILLGVSLCAWGPAAAGLEYAIDPPAGWSVREGAIPLVDLAMTCDADPGTSITVTKAPAEGAKEFSAAQAREMKEMYAKGIPGYTVTAEGWREVCGARAFRLCGRYALGAGGGRMEMQNAQVFFIAGEKLFTITYTSTPGLFMKHLGDFEAAIDGFRIPAPEPPGARPAPPAPRAP